MVGFLSGGPADAGEPPQEAGAKISVLIGTDAAPRIIFGAERLSEALKSAGYQPRTVSQGDLPPDRPLVVAARRGSALGEKLEALGLKRGDAPLKAQGFALGTLGGGLIGVVGQDDSGTLYGLLELAGRVKSRGQTAGRSPGGGRSGHADARPLHRPAEEPVDLRGGAVRFSRHPPELSLLLR